MLEARKLSVQFGGLKAVNDVSFQVWPNEIFSLIGPNGAGKTTIFNLVSGLYRPTSGEVAFEGEVISRMPPYVIARLGIARTFQNIELFEHATVLQNLLVGRHCHRHTAWWQDMFFTGSVRRAELEFRRQVEEVIEFLDLQHYRDSMVVGLPYGVRKVVELARALSMRPRLLLLDEPSSGLDTASEDQLERLLADLAAEGRTLLIATHDVEQARAWDLVLCLNHHQVAFGKPEVTLGLPVLEETYGGALMALPGSDTPLVCPPHHHGDHDHEHEH